MNPAQQAGCKEATLFYIEDYDEDPSLMTIAASWHREDKSDFPVGYQFDLKKFPSKKLFMASPNAPQLIADIPNDDRIDKVLKGIWAKTGSQAMAIIPISQVGRWLGILTFSWSSIHNFSEQEKTIYQAMISLVTPVVQSRHLFTQIQQALTEVQRSEEAIRTNEARLSEAVNRPSR